MRYQTATTAKGPRRNFATTITLSLVEGAPAAKPDETMKPQKTEKNNSHLLVIPPSIASTSLCGCSVVAPLLFPILLVRLLLLLLFLMTLRRFLLLRLLHLLLPPTTPVR